MIHRRPRRGRALVSPQAVNAADREGFGKAGAELLELRLRQLRRRFASITCNGGLRTHRALLRTWKLPSISFSEKLMLGSFQVRSNARLRRVAARSVRLIEREATRELAEHFIEEFGAGLPEAFRDAIRAQFARLRADELVQIKEQCATLAAGADLREVVDLGRVSADTLIVNGADDPLIDAADRATTADCFPHAELRVMRGVGHFLHLEQESVMDTYLAFAQASSPALV